MTPLKSRKTTLLATSLLSATIALPMATATAQERIRERVVETERVLDTVEVTAQKRSQNLQDVPIAIQAFDEARLETLNINGFDDLQTFTPGLIASPNPADSSGLRLSIRGIGQNDPQIGLDATVGLYVNGVYIGKTPGLAFDTPDLARIEVLKGPQGTLYGRNAVAGAINIITKGAEIGEGFGGTLTAEVGNFGTFGFRGGINIPLGDTAAVKLSGLLFDRDGFVENVSTDFPLGSLPGVPAEAGFLSQGQGSDFGGVDRRGLNFDFGWQVTPQLLIEYGFDSSTSFNEPFFSQLVPNADGGFGFLQAPSLAAGTPLVPVTEGFQREAISTIPIEETRSDIQGHRLSAEWNWNEDHTLKVLGAYRRADADSATSFFPELNPFVLGGVLAAGTVDPTAPADPALNPSLLDTLSTVLPGILASQGVAVRPDFAVPLTNAFAPPFFAGPFVSFGTSPVGGIPSLDNHEQFSIELTQSGSVWNDRIRYTGGLFYFDEATAAGVFNDRQGDALALAQLFPTLISVGQAGAVLQSPAGAVPGILGQVPLLALDANNNPIPVLAPDGSQVIGPLGPVFQPVLGADGNPLSILDSITNVLAAARSPGARLELGTQAFAAYGEVTFDLTEQISVTGGLRYSRDLKDAFQQGVSPFFNDTTDLLGNIIPALTGDETFDSLDPKVIIEYTPSDDLLIYASYSQAFRSGGFNQSSVNLDDFVFDEERIRSGEVGFKSDWFNNRVRLNANVFASFIDDQQFTFTNPAVPVARFVENNDAQFIGFEIDGQAVISDGLVASFSYAFLDAEADEFINPFTGAIAGGIDNAPRNSYAVNLDYNRQVGVGELQVHLGFNHKDATTIIGVPRTDLDLLDARLAYSLGEIGGQRVTVFAFGQNLTNDAFTVDGLDVLSAVIGTTQVFGQPRTYGGGITVSF